MLSSGLELLVAQSWVYSRLVTDATLQATYAALGLDVTNQVWEYRAPEGTPEPWITYQRLDSADVKMLGGHRLYSTFRYLIKVVASGEDWGHDDIYKQIESLFGLAVNQSVVDPPGEILACTRFQPWDMPEDVNGLQYRHLGGIYDLAANAA